jgi:hypothetical protein
VGTPCKVYLNRLFVCLFFLFSLFLFWGSDWLNVPSFIFLFFSFSSFYSKNLLILIFYKFEEKYFRQELIEMADPNICENSRPELRRIRIRPSSQNTRVLKEDIQRALREIKAKRRNDPTLQEEVVETRVSILETLHQSVVDVDSTNQIQRNDTETAPQESTQVTKKVSLN